MISMPSESWLNLLCKDVWIPVPLQRRLSQLSEGIEIINRILPYSQSISALSSNCVYST